MLDQYSILKMNMSRNESNKDGGQVGHCQHGDLQAKTIKEPTDSS